ncbi:MAG: hypothetical protein JSU70_19275 [Phycisphaerales bacterium]|nr:MAG: hypothetical protein JSU70_19275 [Phycisphaerales bacterium]
MKPIASVAVVTILAFLAFGAVGSDVDHRTSLLVESGAPTDTYFHVDLAYGDDDNDGLTPDAAFATVQKGIDMAKDGDTVLVWPGTYTEAIDFQGKAITVRSAETPAQLEAPGGFAVTFAAGESHGSVLRNFIIKNSRMAVFAAATSPTITNLTILDNEYGIGAYGHCRPDIRNSIFLNNANGDLFQCQARYSCLSGGGDTNVDADPLFVDPNDCDYHLRSGTGRYSPQQNVWVIDDLTSPCIDAGDPSFDCSDEPAPNGGRVNIGAYGGTGYASLGKSHAGRDVSP